MKVIIYQHLFQEKHNFKTEQKIKDAVCGVIDLDTLVIYEVETYPTMRIRKKRLDDFYHPYVEDITIKTENSVP